MNDHLRCPSCCEAAGNVGRDKTPDKSSVGVRHRFAGVGDCDNEAGALRVHGSVGRMMPFGFRAQPTEHAVRHDAINNHENIRATTATPAHVKSALSAEIREESTQQWPEAQGQFSSFG